MPLHEPLHYHKTHAIRPVPLFLFFLLIRSTCIHNSGTSLSKCKVEIHDTENYYYVLMSKFEVGSIQHKKILFRPLTMLIEKRKLKITKNNRNKRYEFINYIQIKAQLAQNI